MAPKFTPKDFFAVLRKAETVRVPQNLQKYLAFLISFYCKLKNKDMVNMSLEYSSINTEEKYVKLQTGTKTLYVKNKRLYFQIKRYLMQNYDTGRLYGSFFTVFDDVKDEYTYVEHDYMWFQFNIIMIAKELNLSDYYLYSQ